MKFTVTLIILLLFCSSLWSQENKFEIDKYKKIDSKTFVEIIKKNPEIKVNSIFANGKIFAKKDMDSLIRISKTQYFTQIFLSDTVRNELIVVNKELTKEDIKIQKSAFKSKQKNDKEFRNQLDGTIISELAFEDLEGKKYDLESLKGKVIVLNFWFTKCKPCIAEFPDLNKLKEKFKSTPVEFCAVTCNNKETVAEFLLKHKLDFTIVPNANGMINTFKIPHYPFNIVIDKEGKIEYIKDVLVFSVLKKLESKINDALIN